MSLLYAILFGLGILMVLPFSFSFLSLVADGLDDIVKKQPSDKSQLAVSFLIFIIGFLILINMF